MLWRLVCVAGAAVALVSVNPSQIPASAADIGVSSAAETGVHVKRYPVSRPYVPRQYTVVVYPPRYRYARPRIIWQVDASSVQPAYVLR